jgi:hypothetical protein
MAENDASSYQIRIQERLDASWSDWFDDMAMTTECRADGSCITLLSGTVADQTALHGILGRIRDLGLSLLEVKRIDNTNPPYNERNDHADEPSRN